MGSLYENCGIMPSFIVDDLVIFFSLIYYAELVVVFLLRVQKLTNLEWKMNPAFSILVIPFVSLWVLNILLGSGTGRLMAGFPIILYLGYDLWYRALTHRKPYHHPQKWPVGLVVYLLLLFIGSIGLNWYGYLVSQLCGNVLVASFFVMIGSYSYYQYKHNKDERVAQGFYHTILGS